jgi:hypothetical protein
MSVPTRTTQVAVERFAITSSKGFHEIVKALEAAVGRPDLGQFMQQIAVAQTEAEMEAIVRKATGPADLMLFTRFNMGIVLRKEPDSEPHESVRLLIGNPLTMKRMAKHVPDAASYAPVTVLVDERPDGVHLSYDRMASLLAHYENPAALEVARELDSRVEALLIKAAS